MREMFRRSDMVDLYSLADPHRCSKYVMVGAKTLDKLFSSVNLVPAMGSDGRVFFQKIDVIQKANPLGESHQETCKLLAFFFIRIFRIYAALTLSIKDSELPETEPIEKVKSEHERKGLVMMKPGYLEGFRAPPKPEAASWFRGGALKPDIPARAGFSATRGSGNYYLEPARVGRYKILNLYLNVPTDQANPLDSNEDMHFYDSPELRMPQDTLYEFTDVANKSGTRIAKRFTETTTSRPIVIYTLRDSQGRFRNIVGGLFLEDNAGKLEVSLQHIHLDGKPMSSPLSETELLIPLTPTDENPKTKEQKNLTEAVKGLFKKAFEKVEPAQFSGIDFLKKHNIISSLDGNVRMESTSVFVANPKRYRARPSFPVIFTDKLEVNKKQIDVRVEADIAFVKENKTESEHAYKLYIDPDSIRVKPEQLTGYIKKPSLRDHVFYTGVDDSSAPKNRKDHTIPEYLQRVFRNIFSSNLDSLGNGLSYDKQMRAIPYDSEDIPEEFRVKDTWKSLSKDPPIKAHCVARAIQLLNVTAIRDEKSGEGYSNICRVKFPYATDGSLPKPGESVLTEDGIKALAMLYIDGFADNKVFPTNTEEFAQFRLRMKSLFERYETVGDEEPPKTFNEIRDKQMPFCKDRGEKRLRVRGELVQTLRYKVYELLKQQQIHIAKCMQILFKLFNEESIRNGNLEMSDYVIGSGMDALNQLAEEARGVLIDYYSSCEETYKEGLFEINKNPDSIVDV